MNNTIATASPPDRTLPPEQHARRRDSIERQSLLTTLGIAAVSLEAGRVVLELP